MSSECLPSYFRIKDPCIFKVVKAILLCILPRGNVSKTFMDSVADADRCNYDEIERIE